MCLEYVSELKKRAESDKRWMKRVTAANNPDTDTPKEQLEAGVSFVMRHKSMMHRTALRYAIEKMPTDLNAEAMKK